MFAKHLNSERGFKSSNLFFSANKKTKQWKKTRIRIIIRNKKLFGKCRPCWTNPLEKDRGVKTQGWTPTLTANGSDGKWVKSNVCKTSANGYEGPNPSASTNENKIPMWRNLAAAIDLGSIVRKNVQVRFLSSVHECRRFVCIDAGRKSG